MKQERLNALLYLFVEQDLIININADDMKTNLKIVQTFKPKIDLQITKKIYILLCTKLFVYKYGRKPINDNNLVILEVLVLFYDFNVEYKITNSYILLLKKLKIGYCYKMYNLNIYYNIL